MAAVLELHNILYCVLNGSSIRTTQHTVLCIKCLVVRTNTLKIQLPLMSRITRKCIFEHFRPGMTQTGLLSYSD